MTYSVKEIFYTLQGEGGNAGRPAVDGLSGPLLRETTAPIAAATKIVGLGYDRDLSLDAALSEARKLLSTVSPDARVGKGMALAEALEALAVELDARWEGTWKDNVVPTGLHDLDHKLTSGGFEPGQLIIIGARPGAGKTALFMQIALNASRWARYTQEEQPWTVFFSSEMTTKAICYRALAETTGIPIRQLKQGKDVLGRPLSAEVKERIGQQLEEMMSLPLWIDDTSSPTTEQMHERIERLRTDRPLLMGGFDYLEQAGDPKGKGENEETRVSAIAAGLKRIAKTTEIPMVGLAQLNREVEKRADKTPTLADLRQSGRIEQEADIVLLLYREDYYVQQGLLQPTPGKEGTADIKIEKQRDGETGVVTVTFLPEITAFKSLDRSERSIA